MKVVQINCSAGGSTGNIAKAIHRQLIMQGHESYIFYGVGTASEKNMFRVGGYISLHAHAVLSRNLGKQGYFSYASTQKLIRKIDAISPDVIHLHNLHGSYLNLPMLFRYLKKAQASIVMTIHDCWTFTGKCPHFTAAGCERWKNECGNCPQLSIYPRSKLDTTAKSLRDKKEWFSGLGDRMQVVAVSNWLRDTAKQSFLAQYPIQTIYNGIDCSVFCPQDGADIRRQYHLENKFLILGVASSWDDRKGLAEFLSLSEKLASDERIVLVGLSQDQIARLPENVLGIERTDTQHQLAELYSAANVFVNASKEETFGLVTVEAMACGTPVVVYDSTACAEVLSDNGGAALQVTDGTEELLKALRKVGSAFESKACRKTVLDRFRIDTMVQGYIEVYEKKNANFL